MSLKLTISLIVFSIVWIFIIFYCIKHNKISIKYSVYWFLSAFIVLLVGVFPQIIEFINSIFGFEVVSNLIVGMLITLLMILTLSLTIIVTKQKKQIKELIQAVSIIESEKK